MAATGCASRVGPYARRPLRMLVELPCAREPATTARRAQSVRPYVGRCGRDGARVSACLRAQLSAAASASGSQLQPLPPARLHQLTQQALRTCGRARSLFVCVRVCVRVSSSSSSSSGGGGVTRRVIGSIGSIDLRTQSRRAHESENSAASFPH